MTIEDLSKQIKEKDKKYSFLSKQCDDITHQMRKTMDEKYKLEEEMNELIIKELNIAPGQYFILQENEDYHYIIFQILKINSIKNKTVKCTNICYRYDDGNLLLTSKATSYSMKTLLNYIVSKKFKRIPEEEAIRLIKIGLEAEIQDVIVSQAIDIIEGKIPCVLR